MSGFNLHIQNECAIRTPSPIVLILLARCAICTSFKGWHTAVVGIFMPEKNGQSRGPIYYFCSLSSPKVMGKKTLAMQIELARVSKQNKKLGHSSVVQPMHGAHKTWFDLSADRWRHDGKHTEWWMKRSSSIRELLLGSATMLFIKQTRSSQTHTVQHATADNGLCRKC